MFILYCVDIHGYRLAFRITHFIYFLHSISTLGWPSVSIYLVLHKLSFMSSNERATLRSKAEEVKLK